MHPEDHPEATGVARRIRRSHRTQRVIGLMAASALMAAVLITVAAPTASANGTAANSITGCTFNGVQHLEIFLTPEDQVGIPITWDFQGTPYTDGRLFYWFAEIYEEGSPYTDNAYVSASIPNAIENSYYYFASDAGQIWLFTYSAVSGDLDPALFDATGPVGDPLCSITYVMANLDGSDPRPAPPATPVSAPTTAVSCSPLPAQAGATVTCSVTGGDPGIDIWWRASYNPVFAEAGVTLGADGTGSFSFVVPAAALGQEVMVELVEWTTPMSIGVAGSLVPTRIPAGEGRGVPSGALVVLAGVTLFAAVAVRRQTAGRIG
jgi:hypothetical protein